MEEGVMKLFVMCLAIIVTPPVNVVALVTRGMGW